MTSSPLFMRLAESMVIFAPIDQFGCFSASAGRARAISARLQVRNGPPDAVSTIRRIAERAAGS